MQAECDTAVCFSTRNLIRVANDCANHLVSSKSAYYAPRGLQHTAGNTHQLNLRHTAHKKRSYARFFIAIYYRSMEIMALVGATASVAALEPAAASRLAVESLLR
jgi:hypothetical protein